MKKVWKILISLVLILIAGAGGAAYYFLKVKTYDIADKKVEEITKTEYDIILPGEDNESDLTEEASGKETANTVGEKSGSGKSSAIVINAKAANTTNEEPKAEKANMNKKEVKVQKVKNKTKPAEPTVASIKQKYNPSFKHLQKQANKKIDALLAEAYKEYSNQQLKGDSVSYMYFYQKYTAASSDLESNTNAAFNEINKALQEDLKKNGFSPSHAESFKEEYEAAKKARETAILNKIKEAL
ncbi:hypothetical protein J7I93_04200 [Bacillus sp. ISL-47]|uniref:hypothetical protein n=1 Tax=Bacillus sp. ISL-47 TaxID=2819130 RepID=UPI001BE4E664|nr:hypothetical protein [Bacillus sp. ISL-47]MBT2687379.1 hypothetical protein [Bacillus sp. ISL-47]MBT2707159.1 hypothetical protein [Pseudomonas sp. ISL-84]